MSQYTATVVWKRGEGEAFADNKYSRGHQWQFDGGTVVPASSSPHVVPVPYSVTANVDPEEALVAALSSCHMLFFLALAAKRKYVIDDYTDNAIGEMGKIDGKEQMTKVTLRPKVSFSGENIPDRAMIEQLHHRSHELCYIANSVKTEVVVEIVE